MVIIAVYFITVVNLMMEHRDSSLSAKQDAIDIVTTRQSMTLIQFIFHCIARSKYR